MMDNPEFYITEEGGIYRKWAPMIRGIKVFALFFPDGSVFDALVGWRDKQDIEEVRKSYAKAQERLSTADV